MASADSIDRSALARKVIAGDRPAVDIPALLHALDEMIDSYYDPGEADGHAERIR